MRFSVLIGRAARAAVACAALAILVASSGCGGLGTGDAPRFDVVVLSMKSQRASDGTVPPVPTARGSRPILFLVEIPAQFSEARLEARIIDAKGEIVWTGVGLERDTGVGSGPLFIPAGFLRKGEFRLAVGRAQPGVQRAEFPFRVE